MIETGQLLDVGGDTSKLTLGRIATYKSIENLLKSSHLDTKNFLENLTLCWVEEF